MLLLAAMAVVLLTLAAVGHVCDRVGPADPPYPIPVDLIAVRCPASGPTPHPARRRSTAA